MKWIRVVAPLVLGVLAIVALQAAVVAHGPQDTTPLADSSRVFIHPSRISVEQGETFTASVVVENAQDMVGYEFRMLWDRSIVTVTDVADAGFLMDAPLQSMDRMSSNQLRFEAFVLPPYEGGADGAGDLAVVTLQAVGQGISTLGLHHVAWYAAESPETPREPAVVAGLLVVDGHFVYLPLVLRSSGP